MESCLLSSVTYYSGKNKTLTTAFLLFKNDLYFYFFASEKTQNWKLKSTFVTPYNDGILLILKPFPKTEAMKNWSMRKQKEGHSCSISDGTSVIIDDSKRTCFYSLLNLACNFKIKFINIDYYYWKIIPSGVDSYSEQNDIILQLVW